MPQHHEFPFDDPRQNPGYLLWQVTMKWQRAMTQALGEHGLTHTQFVILAALRWLNLQGQPITKSDVARNANVDRMMASKIIRALSKRGLIDEEPHPTSKRAQQVRLTEDGKSAFRAALVTVGTVDAQFFGDQLPEVVSVLQELEGREV